MTKTKVVIVGTGDMARGLVNMYYCFGKKDNGFDLVVTEPIPDVKITTDAFGDVRVECLQDALIFGDVVVLAIPGKHIQRFLESQKGVLCDGSKIIVDISNSYVAGDDIEKALLHLHLRNVVPWVRAFNDNGAVNLMNQEPSTKSKLVTEICGRDNIAIEKVKRFAQEGLGFSVKTIPYDRFKEMQSGQQTIGIEWIRSAIILLIIFLLTEMYAILRYNHFKGYEWYHLPLQVTNKAMCWTAIWGLSLSQVPGVFVKMGDLVRDGRATRKIPWWLLNWLKLRKHLGLLSLYFLSVHVIMSILIFNDKYYSKFYAESGKFNWKGEASMVFGIFGFSFYAIVGLASFPSVGAAMNKAQWELVMGPLVWIALTFGTTHVLIMGVQGWNDQDKWPGGMPPITLMSTLIPLVALFLKFSLFVLYTSKFLYKKIHPTEQSQIAPVVVHDLDV